MSAMTLSSSLSSFRLFALMGALALSGAATLDAQAGPPRVIGGGQSLSDVRGSVVAPGELVGIFSEDGRVRLDVGSAAMKADIPASHESWATRLVIKRLDGPSEGLVREGHVIGIFSEDGRVRLDVGSAAMKAEIPASHESWATRLHVRPLTRSDDAPLKYGEIVGVFSEDGRVRLDVGSAAMKAEIPASHESWATRLVIRSLE